MSKLDNVAGEFLGLLGYIKNEYFKPAEHIARSRLSPGQFQAISILYHKEALPMSELAVDMKISKQQLTPIIAKLIESNLVVRKADENDRRIIRIEITEHGRSIYKALFASIKGNFTEKLGLIPDKELDELNQMVTRMQEILKRAQ
jgi:MarR family transcriptional regulator, organic hydroperoxide resistance regulator